MGVRPMELADVPQVARLVAPMTESRSERDLARFLEQALFAQPWADPEIPSLVYVDGGEILGTIAASLRRARFDGRPIRMVCSSFFLRAAERTWTRSGPSAFAGASRWASGHRYRRQGYGNRTPAMGELRRSSR